MCIACASVNVWAAVAAGRRRLAAGRRAGNQHQKRTKLQATGLGRQPGRHTFSSGGAATSPSRICASGRGGEADLGAFKGAASCRCCRRAAQHQHCALICMRAAVAPMRSARARPLWPPPLPPTHRHTPPPTPTRTPPPGPPAPWSPQSRSSVDSSTHPQRCGSPAGQPAGAPMG